MAAGMCKCVTSRALATVSAPINVQACMSIICMHAERYMKETSEVHIIINTDIIVYVLSDSTVNTVSIIHNNITS